MASFEIKKFTCCTLADFSKGQLDLLYKPFCLNPNIEHLKVDAILDPTTITDVARASFVPLQIMSTDFSSRQIYWINLDSLKKTFEELTDTSKLIEALLERRSTLTDTQAYAEVVALQINTLVAQVTITHSYTLLFSYQFNANSFARIATYEKLYQLKYALLILADLITSPSVVTKSIEFDPINHIKRDPSLCDSPTAEENEVRHFFSEKGKTKSVEHLGAIQIAAQARLLELLDDANLKYTDFTSDSEYIEFISAKLLLSENPLPKDLHTSCEYENVVKFFYKTIALNLATKWKDWYPWDKTDRITLVFMSLSQCPENTSLLIEKLGSEAFLENLFTLPLNFIQSFFNNEIAKNIFLAQIREDKILAAINKHFFEKEKFNLLMQHLMEPDNFKRLSNFLSLFPTRMLRERYVAFAHNFINEQMASHTFKDRSSWILPRISELLKYATKGSLIPLFQLLNPYSRFQVTYDLLNETLLKELVTLDGEASTIKNILKSVKLQSKDPKKIDQLLGLISKLLGAPQFARCIANELLTDDCYKSFECLNILFIGETIAENLRYISEPLWEKILESNIIPLKITFYLEETIKTHNLAEIIPNVKIREQIAIALILNNSSLVEGFYSNLGVPTESPSKELLNDLKENVMIQCYYSLSAFLINPTYINTITNTEEFPLAKLKKYYPLLAKNQKWELVNALKASPMAPFLLEMLPFFGEEYLRDVFTYACSRNFIELINQCLIEFKKNPDTTRNELLYNQLLKAIEGFNFTKIDTLLNAEIDINHYVKKGTKTWNSTAITFPLHALIETVLSTSSILEAFEYPAIKCIRNLIEKYKASLELTIYNSSGYAETLAEYVLFYRGKQEKFAHELFLYLLSRGAKISSKMARKMKHELSDHPVYEELLLAQAICSKSELESLKSGDKVVIGSVEDHIRQLHLGIEQFESLQKLSIFAPSLLNYDEVQKLKALKKTTKLFLEKHPDNLDLKTVYAKFSKEYDKLISSNFLLKELASISKEYRELIKLPSETRAISIRVSRIYSLWASEHVLTKTESYSALKGLERVKWQIEWSVIRQAILASSKKLTRYFKTHHLIWVHGTKFTPYMKTTKSLIPKGSMLSDKEVRAVPFSGELCGSEKSHNKHQISASYLTPDWEEIRATQDIWSLAEFPEVSVRCSPSLLFDAHTHMGTSITYALQNYGVGRNEKFFNLKQAKERLLLKTIQDLFSHVDLATGKLPGRDLSVFLTDILRCRAADPDHKSYLDPLAAYAILDTFKSVIVDKDHFSLTAEAEKEIANQIEEIQKVFKLPISYALTEDDKELLQVPIPVLFGSTNVATSEHITQTRGMAAFTEALAYGEVHFGKEVQIAFTTEAHTSKLREQLAPFGIQVQNFEFAKYLETERMMKGGWKIEQSKAYVSFSKVQKEQHLIANHINLDVLPLYGLPLPETATYMVEGKQAVLPHSTYGYRDMDYTTYLSKLSKGEIPARRIHGKQHATRTSIAAQLFANLQKSKLHHVDSFYLSLAAALHDSARENEGVDYWDEESAEIAYSYFLSLGAGTGIDMTTTAKLYQKALTNKDPKDGAYSNISHEAIHNADVLEILRVIDLKDFRKEELVFRTAVPAEKRDALILEWAEFINTTEPMQLRLEYYPENYYENMVTILAKLCQKEKLPVISELLKEELEVFATRELPPELESLLMAVKK